MPPNNPADRPRAALFDAANDSAATSLGLIISTGFGGGGGGGAFGFDIMPPMLSS
tara:strand:- start:352 stop:516 length:165 start_codon:yes stop_codon:yes gene_type:complete